MNNNHLSNWIVGSLVLASLGVLGASLSRTRANGASMPVVLVHSDNLLYSTLTDLEQRADIIAVVRPIAGFGDREHINTFYKDGTLQDFYTKSKVKVEKVFKDTSGTVDPKNTFELLEPAGIVEQKGKKVKLKVEGYSELENGVRYIVFLQSNGQGGYSVINLNNGKVVYDKVLEKAQDVEELDSKALKLRDDAREKYKL